MYQTHQSEEVNNVTYIGELNPGVIVHDLSFDWAGKRIVASCSDKAVRIYIRKQDGWTQQSEIKVQGASVWKVKWARPQTGVILATCSLDRDVRLYQWKKVKNQCEKNQWQSIHLIQQKKSIQDIKFAPFKQHGLSLAIATAEGYLKVVYPQDHMKPDQWPQPISIHVNENGLNCLSWSKNIIKNEAVVIAVGCKSSRLRQSKTLVNETLNVTKTTQQNKFVKQTIQMVSFTKNKKFQKIHHSIMQNKAINDISWAIMNGRTYYLLAVATDYGVTIYQLNIPDSLPIQKVQVKNKYDLVDTTCYRLSWNVMGTYISVSQKKNLRIWRSISRSVWKQLKSVEDS